MDSVAIEFEKMSGNKNYIRSLIGINRINDEPKLLIEIIGEKTHLGVFGFFILWFLGFFFLVDVLMPLLIIGKPTNLYSNLIYYIIEMSRYNVIWAYGIYLVIYYKCLYLNTIDKLKFDKRIDATHCKLLKDQLLDPKIRRYLIITIGMIFLLIKIFASYNNHLDNPTIFWFVSVERLDIVYTSTSYHLIFWFLHWIPGVVVQSIVLSDIFIILINFMLLGGRVSESIKTDILDPDGHGGMGFFGSLYLKISLMYFLEILLFSLVSNGHRSTGINVLEDAAYGSFIVVTSIIGLSMFIYPQYSFHTILQKQKEKCRQNLINKLKLLNMDVLSTKNNPETIIRLDSVDSVTSIRLTLLLNEIDKISTYSFSKDELIQLIIAISINISSSFIQQLV